MSVGTSAALDLSLALIAASDVSKDAGIIDVDGGPPTLIGFLLDDGYTRLDLSGVALSQSRSRLGARATSVEWFEADVTFIHSAAPLRPLAPVRSFIFSWLSMTGAATSPCSGGPCSREAPQLWRQI